MAFEKEVAGVDVCGVWGGGDGAFVGVGAGKGVDAGGRGEDLYVIRTGMGVWVWECVWVMCYTYAGVPGERLGGGFMEGHSDNGRGADWDK